MTVDVVRGMLLWSAIINYGLLLVWVLIFASPHDWIYRLLSRWFRMSAGQFDQLNFGMIVLYKVGILLFNVVPYIALRIVA